MTPSSGSRAAQPVRDRWPLVGRAALLERVLPVVSEGETRGLVLAGGAGVGKTRFATELVAKTDPSRAAVVRVTATRAAAPIPLGAFAPLLPATHNVRGTGVDDRADYLRRCAASLLASCEGRRLILLVDDAHLLDDASATLVHQLALNSMAFVLATVRSDEACPDPIIALWKDEAVERLEVSALTPDAVGELLLAVLGGWIDHSAVRRLATASEGNVLFLRELVLGAIEDGSLRNEAGIWRLVGTFAPSSRLTELVEARLTGLTPDERGLLELVSIGEPLGSAELDALADRAVAERLERGGLITCITAGRRLEVRLSHPVYSDVLRAQIPVLRTRELCRQLADIVESTGARREDALRIATWRLEGGGSADPGLMLEAATIARWRYDFPLAERLALAARQAGAGFDAALLAAQLVSLGGRGDEAELMLSGLADEASTDRERGLVACTRLDNNVFHRGRTELGLELAEAAERTISDPCWRDELAARRAAIVYATVGPPARLEGFGALPDTVSGRAFAWASILSANALARLGRLEAARLTAEHAYEVHRTLTEPFDWYPWTHIFFRNEALAHEGRINEAVTLAKEQYDQALGEGSPEAQAWFAWQLCKLVCDRGWPTASVQYGREAVALFRQLGWTLFEHFALVHLSLAFAFAGDSDAAAETLHQDQELGLPSDSYPGAAWLVDIHQAGAWAAVARGDLPDAAVRFRRAAEVGAEIGDLVGQSAALHALARIGRADEAADALQQLAAQIEGDLSSARADHASALSNGDGAGLEAVSTRFEAMGAGLLAAESAADAGVAWRRSGDLRRASRCEQRANALTASCQGPVSPALRALRGRSQLTRAERETSLLAASGRSNKEIASQLGLSVRTVENHLQHSYEKLGISGRSQLAMGLENSP